ncbi:ATP-dependent helicase [Paramyrothecium foliicola]|nr:ATP-dependent helicase [Paramyrothecium foliicola]
MAPSKRTPRLPWYSRTSAIEVGLDAFLPDTILSFFHSLPLFEEPQTENHQVTSDDRSVKRRKVEDLTHSSICVAKGSISFTRRCKQNVSPPKRATYIDVGSHLTFNLSEGQLHLLSQTKSELGNLKARITIRSEDLGGAISSILKVTGSSSKSTAPGAIWCDVSLFLEQQGPAVLARFDLQLWWNVTSTPFGLLRNTKERQLSQTLISEFFSHTAPINSLAVHSASEFYEAAFTPSKDDNTPLSIEIPGLSATLFPYQKRTVQWLLGREKVRWSPSQLTVEAQSSEERHSQDTDTLRPVRDIDGNEVFVSDVFQTITRNPVAYHQVGANIQGGILAEEMGLGKTLEILGLILLHKRADSENTAAISPPGTTSSGATLIVAPEALRAQWLSEIARHAPGLRVKYYQGCKKLRDGDEDGIVHELASYDVIITTYGVLSAEIHFATDAPDRSRRHERAYPRAKSPLVQIWWWRICLDEAQMIENGFSHAAAVARLIPRINSWGITGTPVRDNVKDLFGLLLFLRYEPYCHVPSVWQGLLDNKPAFRALFCSISLRHTKAMVRDEIALPRQKRFVISMPFTAVEEQHYQSLFKEMAEACQLDVTGGPVIDDWDPKSYVEAMRTWLDRLRQTALHPEVGVYNRRTLGQNRSRPMRTVDEVLDAMLEQSETAIRTEERTYLSTKLTRGQLFENSPRVREALLIWEGVRKETEKLVAEARAKASELSGSATQDAVMDGDTFESDDDDLLGSEGRTREGEYRRRLRGALELHHKAVFFCANAYFQILGNPEMTEPESEDFHRLKKLEEEGYEAAKIIRREILRGPHGRASRLMKALAGKASNQSFTEIADLGTTGEEGIETGTILNNLEALYAELNLQAELVDGWREHVIQLLLRPLVDEEGEVETTGEELMDSAKMQEELMVYVTALRAAIADRQEAITGQSNELIRYETEAASKMAQEGDGPAPELLIDLLKNRAAAKPQAARTTMRGAISHLRSLQSRLTRNSVEKPREALEHKIASDQLKATQLLLNEQNKAILALEVEIESFTTAMNARLDYYRQLQAVSDSVNPYDGPRTDAAIDRLQRTEDESWRKLSAAQAKHRYLLNLKEVGSKSNEPRMCVICQMPFVTGVLTVCGHQFCKECMMLWFKAHHNCPVCKRTLKMSNLHDITIKPQQLQVHSDESRHETADQSEDKQTDRNESSKNTAIYSEFNSDKLEEIKNIELSGPSFTTKVDTLVRHLLWLRESDPGAKSIIFSQYKDFLGVLQNAFKRFRIGYASIDEQNGITKFKNDASVECFLLHARAHSSGLNLVNANHVFLCEPLLNTAIELQAIARVDRIGQQHETTVWLYLVSGTVEESIYNLSVQRRMEHMGRRVHKGKSKESTPELLDANIEAANTLEMEQAALSKLMSKDRTAGEVVDKSDLWQCLFGHVGTESHRQPERDTRLQERAVLSYLAGEAAEARQ